MNAFIRLNLIQLYYLKKLVSGSDKVIVHILIYYVSNSDKETKVQVNPYKL